MASAERRYSPQQVREILQRVQRPGTSETPDAAGLTHGEVVETAREVGFSEHEVVTALARYEGDQQLVRYQDEVQQLRRRRVAGHATAFLVVNGLLAGINLTVGPPLWFWAPLCLWGLFLLLHLRNALFPDPDQLREQARKRQHQHQLKESTQRFGEAVSRGASALLDAASRRIDDGVARRR